MATQTDLKNVAQELHDLADEIDAKGPNPNAADMARLKSKMAEFSAIKDAVKAAETSTAADKAEARSFLKQLSGGGGSISVRPDSKSHWGEEVARRVTKTVNEFGAKALTTGGIDIPTVVESVVTKPVEPLRVLDLLINRKAIPGNEFEFLRQTVRTNNAAPVADGATKPTSVYTFEDEFDRARVFAHLSEAIPLRYLDDHAEIKNVLSSQMAEDLYLAIEKDALIGDGTGEHFTGVTETTGIQTQAYTTDKLTTLRKARTKLVKAGETPNAWVMNWDDLEAIDLTLDGDDNFMGGIDQHIFGNLPKIGTSTIPAGTAYLADWNQARLYVREGGRLDADVSGVLFEKNQVKLRYEGRFGFAVLRPNAFVEIDLTA